MNVCRTGLHIGPRTFRVRQMKKKLHYYLSYEMFIYDFTPTIIFIIVCMFPVKGLSYANRAVRYVLRNLQLSHVK